MLTLGYNENSNLFFHYLTRLLYFALLIKI